MVDTCGYTACHLPINDARTGERDSPVNARRFNINYTWHSQIPANTVKQVRERAAEVAAALLEEDMDVQRGRAVLSALTLVLAP